MISSMNLTNGKKTRLGKILQSFVTVHNFAIPAKKEENFPGSVGL